MGLLNSSWYGPKINLYCKSQWKVLTITRSSGSYFLSACFSICSTSFFINILQVKARFALNKRKLEEKKSEYELDSRLREAAEEEARVKEFRRERRRDKKRKLMESDEPEDDAPAQSELAQIMGFSGFGGAKK